VIVVFVIVDVVVAVDTVVVAVVVSNLNPSIFFIGAFCGASPNVFSAFFFIFFVSCSLYFSK